MFGAPPQPSEEEIRQQEEIAAQTVYGTLTACVILYFSPFVVDYVKRLV